MKLALRNRIAEWLLEAIAHGEGNAESEGARALVAFAAGTDVMGVASGLDDAARRVLVESGLFGADERGVRLRPDLAGDRASLCDRTRRFAAALAAIGEASLPATEPSRALAAARVLFEQRLFFEVHEILEPPWRDAAGADREVLQGLIQVAVGFHHHEDGNLRGAISLLADGNAKLFAHVPEAFGIDLETLCREVETFAIALRHQTTTPPLPHWRPTQCPP